MFEIQVDRTELMSAADDVAFVAEQFEHIKTVLTRLGIEPVAVNEDGMSINIRDGEFALDPLIYLHTPPAIVPRQRQQRGWSLTQFTHIPGRWNPYDGGSPPDVREKEIGVFTSPFHVAREILTMDIAEKVANLAESMEYERMQQMEEFHLTDPET